MEEGGRKGGKREGKGRERRGREGRRERESKVLKNSKTKTLSQLHVHERHNTA